MGKKRKSGDKEVAKLALIAAILGLITSLVNLIAKLLEK